MPEPGLELKPTCALATDRALAFPSTCFHAERSRLTMTSSASISCRNKLTIASERLAEALGKAGPPPRTRPPIGERLTTDTSFPKPLTFSQSETDTAIRTQE